MATLEDRVDIRVDTQTLAGTLFTPGGRVPAVLFVHGWGGSQEQYHARAREIAALGCACLTFNLRGHVETRPMFESVSRETNLRDIVAAYDLLVGGWNVDRAAVAVVGSSYGGYLGAILTTMRPVRWLALRAPALYIDTGWATPKLQLHQTQDLKAYRGHVVRAAENRALAACQDFKGDVLLVESEGDQVVPQTVLSSYREACTHARSLTYRCIPAADHGLTTTEQQSAYTKLLVGWLTEMALTKPAAPPPEPAQSGPDVLPETPPKAI